MGKLTDLIAKLEAASEGSRELDLDIAQLLREPWGYTGGETPRDIKCAPITTSLDAIVELKLPGWCFELRRGRVNTCTLYEPDDPAAFITDPWPRKHEAAGRTLALAACSSFLRALQAQQETSEDE